MSDGKFEKLGVGIGVVIIGTLAGCFVIIALTTIIALVLWGPFISAAIEGWLVNK